MSNSTNTAALVSSVAFVVPVVRVEQAVELLETANKKISKLALNLPAIKWSVSAAFMRGVVVVGRADTVIEVLCQRITIENLPSRLGLSSWELIASLEHLGDAGNVVYSRNAAEIPAKYRATDFTLCEHCNVKRARNKTLIVRHVETSEYKQVGTSCLKDFLGHDVGALLTLIENTLGGLQSATSSLSSEEHNASRQYMSIVDVVAWSLAAVRYQGRYVSSANSNSFAGLRHASTATAIQITMGDPSADQTFSPLPSDFEMASIAVDWCLSQEGVQDTYMRNLQVICQSGYVTPRNFNIAISLVVGFQREHIKLQQEQDRKRNAAATHQGAIGEKIAREVTILRTFATSYEVAYRVTTYSTLYILRDDAGNTYKCNTGIDIGKEGERVFIVATVKAHDTYKGTPQTVLQRPKKTDTLEDLTPKPKGTRGRKPKAKIEVEQSSTKEAE
jgi:hypothetical protein